MFSAPLAYATVSVLVLVFHCSFPNFFHDKDIISTPSYPQGFIIFFFILEKMLLSFCTYSLPFIHYIPQLFINISYHVVCLCAAAVSSFCCCIISHPSLLWVGVGCNRGNGKVNDPTFLSLPNICPTHTHLLPRICSLRLLLPSLPYLLHHISSCLSLLFLTSLLTVCHICLDLPFFHTCCLTCVIVALLFPHVHLCSLVLPFHHLCCFTFVVSGSTFLTYIVSGPDLLHAYCLTSVARVWSCPSTSLADSHICSVISYLSSQAFYLALSIYLFFLLMVFFVCVYILKML